MYRFNRQIYRTSKRRATPVPEIHREKIKIAVGKSLYGTGEELKQKGYDIIKCPPGYSYEKIEEFLNDNDTMAYLTVDKRYFNRVSNRNFLIYGVFIKGPDHYKADLFEFLAILKGNLQNSAAVSDGCCCIDSFKGGNISHIVSAIFPSEIIERFITSLEAYIDADIRNALYEREDEQSSFLFCAPYSGDSCRSGS